MKTLAIVGSHPRTRDNAPFDDENIDIWVLNEAANTWARGRRVTGCFQIHIPELYQRPTNVIDPDHWLWLQNKHGYPIWMQVVDPSVPDAQKYPLDNICEITRNLTLHGKRVNKLTSSPAYALALAVHFGYEVIKLYGMDLESNTEYAYQREGFLFWLGVASQKAKIELYCCESLFDDPLYGYEIVFRHTPKQFAKRATALKRKIPALSRKYKEARRSLEASYPDFRESLQAALEVAKELGNMEGRLEAALKRKEEAAQLEKGGECIIDRSLFEMSAALQQKKVEEAGANVYRFDGKLDYTMTIYQQTPTDEVLEQVKQYIECILSWARKAANEAGFAEENLDYMKQYDAQYTGVE